MPGIKWHPGHYMQVSRGNNETVQSNRFGYYDKIANNTDIVGVMVSFRWSMLESSRGNYSEGIATIREEINYLKNLSVPKRFYMRIMDFDYGGSDRNSSYFPRYLSNGGGTYVGSNGVGWCRWEEQWMDAYIHMIEAYAAVFDQEPYFEGIYLYRETAPALGDTSPCGYSASAYQAQTERMLRAAGASWQRTNVVLSANYLGSQRIMDRVIAHGATNRVGVGGPDVLPPSCATQYTWAYNTITGASGHDFRGDIPIQYSVEASEMGGTLGDCTLDEIRDFANDTLRASHIFWDRNTWAGSAAQQWPAVVMYIANRANDLTHTNCPRVYTQGCDTE